MGPQHQDGRVAQQVQLQVLDDPLGDGQLDGAPWARKGADGVFNELDDLLSLITNAWVVTAGFIDATC